MVTDKKVSMQDISQDILIKAQDGDLAAFKKIYAASAGFVYNVSLRVTGNREDAEEVTQDVFVAVFSKLKNFRFESSFKTWVYRIAFNSALNYSRKGSHMKKVSVPYDESLIEHMQAPPGGQDRMDLEEHRKLAERLLSAVNPDQRACLVLREMEGFSYQEIAGILKININTVRSRLKRAREQLLSLGKKVDYAGM